MDDFEKELIEALETPDLPGEDKWDIVRRPTSFGVADYIKTLIDINRDGPWNIDGQDYGVHSVFIDETTEGPFVTKTEIVLSLAAGDEIFEYRFGVPGEENE